MRNSGARVILLDSCFSVDCAAYHHQMMNSPEQWSFLRFTWISRFKSALTFLVLAVATAALLYVGAYLVLVRRIVFSQTAFGPDGGRMHYVLDVSRIQAVRRSWYLPLAKFDNKYVRPHYWETYYARDPERGTNVIYLNSFGRTVSE